MVRLLFLPVVLGFVGVFAHVAPADKPADPAEVRQILKTHCRRCHSGEGSSNGVVFWDATNHATLVKPIDDEPPAVVANSLTKSPLWEAIQKRMPQRGSSERDGFGDAERAAIKAWIIGGAAPFPETIADRPFVPLKAVLTAVRDHLRKADPADRPYLRYFSVAHNHNDKMASDEDLRYLRAALSKVLNSLSWNPRIVVPEAIDPAGTAFAFDVRRLDWDGHDLWRKVVDAYPYGLKYGSHPDRELRELDQEIVEMTGADLAWVRADWFVATASRPPLYHDLLRLPDTATALEEQLRVDIPANFLKGKLARAAFARSGVSGQNRLVERHDAAHGAYWKSYDFLPTNGRASLVRFPLGPDFARHPHPDQAFRHDGGEVIFHLPNGLQGYLLVDGKDKRIDAGPIDVVADDKRVSGTPAIVNGISCMACHAHGMIPLAEGFKAGSFAVFGEPARTVDRLYPGEAAMAEHVAADRDRFLAALEKAVGPFLRADGDRTTPLTKFREPVSEVVIPYRRGYLDRAAAGTELFLEQQDALTTAIPEKRLRELGLEPLLRSGGVIPRYQWEAIDGVSLMQEAARELRFTPLR